MDQKTALEIFEYRDGELYWLVKPCRRDPIGMKAGTLNKKSGYKAVCYKRKKYYVHRLIYLMHTGVMPIEIDHIDGDPSNNRVENLRECNRSENGFNKSAQRNNKSGVKNIHWCDKAKKWIVYLKINGKNTNFGGFEDLDLAVFVASELRDKHHRTFARHA